MLRGSQPATVDEKGRIKIPTVFRNPIREAHGRELFLTSLTGYQIAVYPMPIWGGIED